MLPRLLFVLLIALNIAVAAWLLLGGNGHYIGDVADDGVPRLKLVAEAPPAPATSVPPVLVPTPPASAAAVAPVHASAPTPEKTTSVALPPVAAASTSKPPAVTRTPPLPAVASTRRTYRCMTVGPFTSPLDAKTARTALGNRVIRSRPREEQTIASRGWRVYLTPQKTHEQALEMARRLGEKNVTDYFVVTSGDEPNSIALGLFRDPANARKRRDEVAALGFPARMAERTDTVPAFWLDIVVNDEPKFDWHTQIRTPGVGARSAGCF
jgi:hypothetical protein